MTNNSEVYNKLSVPNDYNDDQSQKWNAFLIACCVVASLASFSFGYNIGVTNLPTSLVKDFYSRRYFSTYYDGLDKYNKTHEEFRALRLTMKQAKSLSANDTENDLSTTLSPGGSDDLEQRLEAMGTQLNDTKKRLNEGQQRVENAETILWTLTTAIFVVGGVIGAFISKFFAEMFGRKKAIVFHYSFGIVAGFLTILAPYVKSPECIIIGRFLFGMQGGITCGLIPGYLNEISPKKLRGATGVMQQLFLTIGILFSQFLGIRQLLGVPQLWHILLAFSAVPSIIGGILLLFIFPDSPSSLINRDHDEEAAREALEKLRQSKNVSYELDQIIAENRESKSDRSISVSELFTAKELRWPLITSIVLQLTQQLCGINAIFFYSESIFKDAKIRPDQIQYAVLATGLINVIATIVALPLIDKLGRKPLLVYPMLFIIVDYIVLTFFLIFKDSHFVISYLSIVCIVLFIIAFAVGLGPIPFIYVAEVFRAEARSTALAISMFTNWMANLLLTLTFPYMAALLRDYTFLVFSAIVAFAVVVIIKKVPETKGRTVDEIMASFDRGAANHFQEASGRLMNNTNV